MSSKFAILNHLNGIRTVLDLSDEGSFLFAIAWVQVIEERWPMLWSYLRDKPEITWEIINIKIIDEIKDADLKNVFKDVKKWNDVISFINNTKVVKIEHILPIISLKTEAKTPLKGEVLFKRFLDTDNKNNLDQINVKEFNMNYIEYLGLGGIYLNQLLRSGLYEAVLTGIRALLKTVEIVSNDKLKDLGNLIINLFDRHELRKKIIDIDDPLIVKLISISDKNKKNSNELLGEIAKSKIENKNEWMVSFIENAANIGEYAQKNIRDRIIKLIDDIKDQKDKKSIDEKMNLVNDILLLIDKSEAQKFIINIEVQKHHAETLKPEDTDMTSKNINIQFLISKVISKEQKYKPVLKIIEELTNKISSKSNKYEGNIQWIVEQLNKFIPFKSEMENDDINQIYQVSKLLYKSMEEIEKAPIIYLLSITIPFYNNSIKEDQKWLKDNIVNSIKNKTLLINDVIQKILKEIDNNNFNNPYIKLCFILLKAYSSLKLSDEELNILHDNIKKLKDKMELSNYKLIEENIFNSWLQEDFNVYYLNVTKLIDYIIKDNTSHIPSDDIKNIMVTKMSDLSLKFDIFKFIWNKYISWPKSFLNKLWDTVRDIYDSDDNKKQLFILEELKKDNIKDKILYNDSVKDTFASNLDTKLMGNKKLINNDSPIINVLFDMIPPNIIIKISHFVDILNYGLNNDLPNIKAAILLAQKVISVISKRTAQKIIPLLKERADYVKGKDISLFNEMKIIAKAYCKKTKKSLPICFSDPKKEKGNEGKANLTTSLLKKK